MRNQLPPRASSKYVHDDYDLDGLGKVSVLSSMVGDNCPAIPSLPRVHSEGLPPTSDSPTVGQQCSIQRHTVRATADHVCRANNVDDEEEVMSS